MMEKKSVSDSLNSEWWISNADSCFQPGRHTIVKIPVRLPEDKSWSTLNGRTTSSVLCRSTGSNCE